MIRQVVNSVVKSVSKNCLGLSCSNYWNAYWAVYYPDSLIGNSQGDSPLDYRVDLSWVFTPLNIPFNIEIQRSDDGGVNYNLIDTIYTNNDAEMYSDETNTKILGEIYYYRVRFEINGHYSPYSNICHVEIT